MYDKLSFIFPGVCSELLKFSQCVDVHTLIMKMYLRQFSQNNDKHPIQTHVKI